MEIPNDTTTKVETHRQTGFIHDDVMAELTASLEKFEKENVDLIAELDLLGMGINEYEDTLVSLEPQKVITKNTTLSYDME